LRRLEIEIFNNLNNPKNPNHPNNPMKIGALQKFSLLDYPEHLSAIIFTQGCNFRCQFCYNPMLVLPVWGGKSKYAALFRSKRQKGHPGIKEDDLFVFLQARVGKLDAVVITGGEPTIQPDLARFITKIKKLGYLIKLDTNGSNPEIIKKLIAKKLIDYIAMDIKAPEEKYQRVVGKKVYPVKSGKAGAEQFNGVDFNKIRKSVKIIKESNLPYEFRTTIVPGLIDQDDIARIGELIKGADKWYLQQFKSNMPLINKKLEKIKAYNSSELAAMQRIGLKYAKQCEVR